MSLNTIQITTVLRGGLSIYTLNLFNNLKKRRNTMIVGKHSWKGMLLFLYVALTICAAIGCFISKDIFFTVVGVALMLCNGYTTWKFYQALKMLGE